MQIPDIPLAPSLENVKVSPVGVIPKGHSYYAVCPDISPDKLELDGNGSCYVIVRAQDGLDYKVSLYDLLEYYTCKQKIVNRETILVSKVTTKETLGDRMYEVAYELEESCDISHIRAALEEE